MKLTFFLAVALLCPSTGTSQALDGRPLTRYDLGLGIGRLAERYCQVCASGRRTAGPALLLRASHQIVRLLEVGAEVQAQAGGGRHFEALLGSIAVVSPAQYAAWVRVGAGILHQPGEQDDVIQIAQSSVAQHGSELAGGILFAVGLEIPLNSRRGLTPQLSYIRHLGSEGRFDLLLLGVALRFY